QAARAALLGTGVPAVKAGQAPRQPPLLPAPGRHRHPPDQKPAVRPGVHHRRGAQQARRRRGAHGRHAEPADRQAAAGRARRRNENPAALSNGLRARHPVGFLAVCAMALIAWLGLLAPAHGADLSSSVQQNIRAATFEVVQLKPPEGEVTYDRELPMDLLPYQQRTDKYRSIGTAFAIGPNRYVRAAHVIDLAIGSQFGPPALRDGAGKVYDVDQVFKFSDGRDFVLFSLREPPKDARSLAAGRKPALNSTVYAVGNALGEGVIIRDGLYTSDTPEELDGRWQWLRFSAAASPGNSGGPLIDEHGKVIGVVLRKSPAENLNMALPIAEL